MQIKKTLQHIEKIEKPTKTTINQLFPFVFRNAIFRLPEILLVCHILSLTHFTIFVLTTKHCNLECKSTFVTGSIIILKKNTTLFFTEYRYLGKIIPDCTPSPFKVQYLLLWTPHSTLFKVWRVIYEI